MLIGMSQEDPEKSLTKAKHPGGRPPKLVADEDTLKKVRHLANIQCTQLEAAGALLVAEATFEQFLRNNIKAREAWDLGLSEGRASLRRTQFKQAQRSAAMSIWLGKQYLGQKDKQEIGGIPGGAPIGVEHSGEIGMTALLRAAREANREDKEGGGDKG